MNTFERRRFVKEHAIDTVIKAPVNRSRRQRSEAGKKLRKTLAAKQAASVQSETISYPRWVSM